MTVDTERMMMQRRIDNLIEQLEIVKRERDALLEELKYHSDFSCACCKHGTTFDGYCADSGLYTCKTCTYDCVCKKCDAGLNMWEWRGVQGNGGAEDA